MAEVVIPARFNGPPETAHGGYACAVAAQFLGWSAEVSLRRPPPLERPLEVHRADDGSVTLLDGDAAVIQARPADLHLDIPQPVSLAEAQAAAEACPWLVRHPFPTCFGCGPERRPGDGLREFPGPVAGREGMWATPWVPDASLADSAGEVDPIFTFRHSTARAGRERYTAAAVPPTCTSWGACAARCWLPRAPRSHMS